jgi:GlpG protein
VHVNALHLGFNIYGLWILARPLEAVLGRLRLGAFLVASAFVSSAAQLAVSDDTGVGASGVGFALFGLAWILSLHRPDLGIRMPRQTVQAFAAWLLFGIFATRLRLVNFGNTAHFFGALFGICAGFAFTERWNRNAVTGVRASVAWAFIIAYVAPWSPSWNEARAKIAYRRGDYASAIEWLDRSLQHGGEPAWIMETKTMVHWQAGAKDEFRADLEVLRKIDAKRADAFERQIRGEER